MNNPALVTFLFFAFFFCFSQTKALFLCLFSTLPQYNIQKNRSTIMKKYFFFCIYNPQIEMFARFKMKSSFHKTKRII